MDMTALVGYILLFVFIAVVFVFIHLVIGRFLRPAKMNPEKATIYECGEPTIGSAWIQFDLRFYVIALLFVVFDVEVAFFFPWAVVFGNANTLSMPTSTLEPTLPARQEEAFNTLLPAGTGYAFDTAEARAAAAKDAAASESVRQAARNFAVVAFFDILVFFGVLLVGFAYLWKRGDLVWVRSYAAETTGEAAAERIEDRAQELAGTAS